MKKVYVAIPAKDGNVGVDTMHSLVSGMRDAMVAGWDVIIQGNSQTPIESARNSEAVKFLATDATDLFYIDSDLTWGEGMFLRMLEHPVDFVGASYPYRIDAPGFPVQWKEQAAIFRVDRQTGLGEVNGVPGGWMRIKRHVIEKMVKVLEDRWYHEPGLPGGRAYDLFCHRMIDHWKHSEDFTFCRNWRDMGGHVWLDPEISFGHVGKKMFTGNLAQWMKSRNMESKYAPILISKDGKFQHFYKTIPGWFPASGGDFLYKAAVEWAPEGSYFVEIGAWKGCSAAYMAVEIANSGKLIAFEVIDHFKGSNEAAHQSDSDVQAGKLRQAFEWHVRTVRDFITDVLEDDSVHAATRYRDGSLDFVFIDASHDKESVIADIRAWLPKLKPGVGVIAGDDFSDPAMEVGDAVKSVFALSRIHTIGRCWFVVPESERGAAFLNLVLPQGVASAA